jgi:hypothetical protein
MTRHLKKKKMTEEDFVIPINLEDLLQKPSDPSHYVVKQKIVFDQLDIEAIDRYLEGATLCSYC